MLRSFRVSLPVTLLLIASRPIAQQDMVAEWNRPFQPFRIIGNVHYVGTNELGVYLITSKAGHVLIDGGFAETAPLILDSIRALGFEPRDIKALLTTQAHMDHVGSMAALEKATGARTMVMEQDVAVMERGGKGDFTFGESFTFPPVNVDRRLKDGDVVRIGDTTLTARLTAGHTQGCTTWTMAADDRGRRVSVVFTGSLTVNPPVRLVSDPSYPGIAQDYDRSFALMRSLQADVFLGAHAGFFRLHDKAGRLRGGEEPNPFIDPAGLTAWVDAMERQFRARIEKEKTAQSGSGAGLPQGRFTAS
jgi:metallo-beta-lactamase class B